MSSFLNFFKGKNKNESCCCCENGKTLKENQNTGIGTFLIEKNLITEEQLSNALAYQNENKSKKIGEILYEINLLGEEEVLTQLADYLKVEHINLDRLTFPLKIQRIFDKKIMVEKVFAPFDLSGNIISIAISDINNKKLKSEIEQIIKAHSENLNPVFYLALPKMIRKFIINSYEKHPHERATVLGVKKKFGEYLLEKKLITKEQIESILEKQKEYVHKRFGELLYEMKMLNREDVLKELAIHEGKEYESLEDKQPQNNLMILFELDDMLMNSFTPFDIEGDVVKIAINNIFDDDLIKDITNILAQSNFKCKFYISMRDSIRSFIEKGK
ncbi:MAG: hypothetical protein ACM3KR_06345 [Deltaproteobacteria bacterium]